jgi:hypothetical protein
MAAIERTFARKQRCRALMLAASLIGANGLAQADAAHPFKLPGTDTSVTFAGYVKLDAIWSDHSAGVGSVGDQELNMNLIPVGPTAGEHKNNQVTLHARQSRLSLGTSTPTQYGELKTFIEGDFFGAAGNETDTNSNGLRLRHAYGTLGRLTAGQTWTNFFDERTYPELVDFGGPAGEIFVRQAQVRWTDKLPFGEWSVSAENPESLLAVPGSAALLRSDSDHAPDLTGRVRFGAGGASYSVGLLARNVHVDTAATNAGKWGGALALAGVVPVFGDDDVRFDVNVGNAIGRYQVPGFFPDGYLDASGNLRLARQSSGFVAYRHFWAPTLRSTLELSATDSRPPEGTPDGVNESGRSQHLNLIWSPIPAVNLGVELIHAQRNVVGGDKGSLNRVQFAAQYNF